MEEFAQNWEIFLRTENAKGNEQICEHQFKNLHFIKYF